MIAARIICLVFLFCVFSVHSSAGEFTNAIQAFLQQRVLVEKRSVGIVVGIVDEHGSRVVSYGKMDNGTDQEVNGDTLFDIASITKPFTGLLLQDMIERGEMKRSRWSSRFSVLSHAANMSALIFVLTGRRG